MSPDINREGVKIFTLIGIPLYNHFWAFYDVGLRSLGNWNCTCNKSGACGPEVFGRLESCNGLGEASNVEVSSGT